jgi:hypothetical protein
VTYLTPTAGVGRPSFPRRPIVLTSNRVKRIPLAATPATVAGANVLSRTVCQAHVVCTARCGSVLVRASHGAWSSHYSVEPKPPVVWWWSQIALRDGALMTLVGTVCKPVRPRCGFSATALDASMLPSQRAVIERSPPWRNRHGGSACRRQQQRDCVREQRGLTSVGVRPDVAATASGNSDGRAVTAVTVGDGLVTQP